MGRVPKNANPFRPISARRLRALLKYTGLSNRALAAEVTKQNRKGSQKTTISPQTVDYLTAEPPKQSKIRSDQLEAMARVFSDRLGVEVPVNWLAGTQNYLEFVGPWQGSFNLTGSGWERVTEGLPGPDDAAWTGPVVGNWLGVSPLIINGFLTRCDRAARKNFPEEEDRLAVMNTLKEAIDPTYWRTVCIAPLPDNSVDRMDWELSVPLCEVLGKILEPWLNGKRALHLAGLRDTFPLRADALAHVMRKPDSARAVKKGKSPHA